MLHAIRVTVTRDGRVKTDESLDGLADRDAVLTFLDESSMSPDREDALMGEAQVRAAADVLEEEDFSDWPGHADAVARAQEKRSARS
jgi:hypothetical protein